MSYRTALVYLQLLKYSLYINMNNCNTSYKYNTR